MGLWVTACEPVPYELIATTVPTSDAVPPDASSSDVTAPPDSRVDALRIYLIEKIATSSLGVQLRVAFWSLPSGDNVPPEPLVSNDDKGYRVSSDADAANAFKAYDDPTINSAWTADVQRAPRSLVLELPGAIEPPASVTMMLRQQDVRRPTNLRFEARAAGQWWVIGEDYDLSEFGGPDDRSVRTFLLRAPLAWRPL